MITFTRLGRAGRLGNQMWQVASTAGIAQTLGQSVALPDWDYRAFFKVPNEFFDRSLIRDDGRATVQAQNTDLVNHMDARAREYLQDLGLWEAIAPQVWSWFQPSDLALDRIRKEKWFLELPRPILSVHVRRGDMAESPNNCHPVRPFSYYEESIEKLDGEFESIIVFSDDAEWCRTAFKGYEAKYEVAFFEGTPRPPEHKKAYAISPILDWLDLQIMSMCDRHIIANSTYSWWGAFLSHDEHPLYPWPWFGTDLSYIDSSLMFPENWVRIDHGQLYV